ncbi:type I restriction enzyme M protein [Streptococcus gallinaceus]|uniref:type I restriction-modification system subunit M n=1 Tax=Streptococcus gallinaceus TaxID=165758 RepID=UPI0020A1B559|nr:class I SAM-dependent DNA methyltransferase [Streptococcus gallinaceus]MCP1638572.1 type I restriction enzyme M protein [Streptococcus gallinaceus]MCP1769341.1 type I restriction enzyme M protein [Streptococcus gallinaceus]
MSINIADKSNFIWKIADLLRGDYKQSEYGDVILPFTVLTRLDSVLRTTKDEVLKQNELLVKRNIGNKLPLLKKITGLNFYNTSEFTFDKLKNDSRNIEENLIDYIKGFSDNAREILDSFDIYNVIGRLNKAGLLYQVFIKFADEIDLHPSSVSNQEMGYIFEELIRKFSEISNETAGEHFTPREVIRLMVSLLFTPDLGKICAPSFVAKLYDPACGTGGMLSSGVEYALEQNNMAKLAVYGQELNEHTYAISKSDTLIKGENYENIYWGNTLSDDKLKSEKFNYMLCNPPFGVEWKKYEKEIKDEAINLGYKGRFGAGLPRISDGSLLFLQHMISKMIPKEQGGSRIAIVFNGSPLFTGDAGSGESEIRKWIIENGMLETIVALPDQLFYNTGILTYVWIVTNNKSELRKGKIQLIDATKPLGEKRKQITEEQISQIVNLYGNFVPTEESKIFDEDDFAYWKVVVERPLRLNFNTAEERVAKLYEQTAFKNLATSKKKKKEEAEKEIAEGEKLQETIIKTLESFDSTEVYKNRVLFTEKITKAFGKQNIKLKAPVLKSILQALSEKDESADICYDAKGNKEADSELRDTEQIPVKEDIQQYFEKEVLPYAPDAWIDETKTKKGYEIPFTRHFYQYTELGDADDTLKEIEVLHEKIQNTIKELFSEV